MAGGPAPVTEIGVVTDYQGRLIDPHSPRSEGFLVAICLETRFNVEDVREWRPGVVDGFYFSLKCLLTSAVYPGVPPFRLPPYTKPNSSSLKILLKVTV